jgi:histidinol-phosphate/aromatic aminotransferase/cobyric acid decarboxylase-like protein
LPRLESHGGNLEQTARLLGCRSDQLLDASASVVPFAPPWRLRRALLGAACGWRLRSYPDRSSGALRAAIAPLHGLEADWILPGNGAAELFTWAGRDAAAAGLSLLPQPGFSDYSRALRCWHGQALDWPLPLTSADRRPQPFPFPDGLPGACLWITNPHNPTGQLWDRRSLEALLPRFALVIVDEAFLPLVPDGEAQSLIGLLPHHPNLVVIRSLTKLFAIAGLRLGYALAHPDRLQRWAAWRDPWPINAMASAAGQALLSHPRFYRHWCARVQRWVASEGTWLQQQLSALPGLQPQPSAANFLLLQGLQQGQPRSLQPLREALEQRHRILLRDCRSFAGLDASWLRIGYQNRRGNQRLVAALAQELGRHTLPSLE